MNIRLTLAPTLITVASLVTFGASRAAAAADPAPVALALAASASPDAADGDDRVDELYDEGREAIEEGRYDRAIERFDRLIALKTNRTDAALYWRAYSLAKTGNRGSALQTLTDLQKGFADSRWIKDAKALEVEVRQASGRTVGPDQNDAQVNRLAL